MSKEGNKRVGSTGGMPSRVIRSYVDGVVHDKTAEKVLVPSLDGGEDKEGFVVFSRKAEYKRPSFL